MRMLRTLLLLSCAGFAGVLLATGARASATDAGQLSVDGGKGLVVLDLRGSVLGRLAGGVVTVTDRTPNDPYMPIVVGRKLTQVKVGPRTTRYRGVGLRFRMLGGSNRIVIRGAGISLSAVGWGLVQLQADRTLPTDDAGVYSVDGTDCTVQGATCTPLPDITLSFVLGTVP
jgi:hypothetical protein